MLQVNCEPWDFVLSTKMSFCMVNSFKLISQWPVVLPALSIDNQHVSLYIDEKVIILSLHIFLT